MKWIKRIITKISYNFQYRFEWIKIYFSPFKPPKAKLYCGEVAIGTPLFYPRRWVKVDDKGTKRAIPKKFGFDFCGLGYKTKWSSDDYRFEWNPVWSFVFFGYQIAICFVGESELWEGWLYYKNHTDKSLSIIQRVSQARQDNPMNYTAYRSGGEKQSGCYYNTILKEKFL